jgi:hypothetical protein
LGTASPFTDQATAPGTTGIGPGGLVRGNFALHELAHGLAEGLVVLVVSSAVQGIERHGILLWQENLCLLTRSSTAVFCAFQGDATAILVSPDVSSSRSKVSWLCR